MSPLVTVISVNYNEPEETELFLDSLYASDYKHLETFVVDNGSKKKISTSLENNYPKLKCIISEENLGFAGGNNLAIKEAKGKYILFLNNDTLIPTDFISTIVKHMEDNPELGICSPKVVYPDGIIQYAGGKRMHPLTGRGIRIGLYDKDKGQYDKIYPTDLPHGAAMIVLKEAIDKVGPMPEEYFLYYEELDWCMMIKRAGYKMSYMGLTHVVHKESLSIGADSPLKVYYLNRNRILFQIRNSDTFSLISGMLFYLFFAFPKSFLTFLILGKIKHAQSLWRGLMWHLNKKYVFKN